MAKDWYYVIKGVKKPQGPCSKDDLVRLIDNNEITYDTYAWKKNVTPKWTPIKEIKELNMNQDTGPPPIANFPATSVSKPSPPAGRPKPPAPRMPRPRPPIGRPRPSSPRMANRAAPSPPGFKNRESFQRTFPSSGAKPSRPPPGRGPAPAPVSKPVAAQAPRLAAPSAPPISRIPPSAPGRRSAPSHGDFLSQISSGVKLKKASKTVEKDSGISGAAKKSRPGPSHAYKAPASMNLSDEMSAVLKKRAAMFAGKPKPTPSVKPSKPTPTGQNNSVPPWKARLKKNSSHTMSPQPKWKSTASPSTPSSPSNPQNPQNPPNASNSSSASTYYNSRDTVSSSSTHSNPQKDAIIDKIRKMKDNDPMLLAISKLCD